MHALSFIILRICAVRNVTFDARPIARKANQLHGINKLNIMSTKELVSPEGLRCDGRRPNELRQIKVKMGLFSRADGSCYYEQGNTKILVAVYGPREVKV